MQRLKLSAVLLLCFLFAVLAARGDACVCVMTMEGTHPCQLYRDASAVFLGQVINIGPMTPVNQSPDGQTMYTMRDVVVQFSIEEGFRGVAGQTVDLYLTGTSCDFSFQKGERYFVYARRDPTTQKLHAGSCSGTQLFSYAARDLAYARAVVRGEKSPDIFGSVVRQVRQDAADYVRTVGIAGIKVILQSADHNVAVFTDSEGHFEIAGLPAGHYRARAEIPQNLRLTYRTEQELEVGEGRCSGVAFVTTLLSRITGRLADADGKPVADVQINLVPVDANNKPVDTDMDYQANTAMDGRYSFDTLCPGRYVVAINPKGTPRMNEQPYRRTYYPSAVDLAQAVVMTLNEGQDVSLDDFHLPRRLVEASIEGIVSWPDGRQALEAMVSLEFTDQLWTEGFKQVDEQGHFSLKCYEGFKYIVHAEVRQSGSAIHAAPVEITVVKQNKPVALILNQQGYDRKYTPKKTP